MISFHSINFYLFLFVVLTIILNLLGIADLGWTELFSYASMFWGIGAFYYSYLRNLRTGLFSGSLLFLIGAVLFFTSKFEMINLQRIFIPAILSMIGFALLLTNILVKPDRLGFALSLVFLIAGILLLIFRGDASSVGFISSVYQIVKEFWVLTIIFAGIIFLSILEFNRERRRR